MAVNIGVNIQRSPNRINQALRAAGVNGQYPKLLFDFDDEYYLTNGSSKTFANAMTFARAGLATMVDSDGLIKWAPHNLLTYSEDLSKWTKGSQTLDLNSALAPDGTQTADKLIASTSSAYQQVTYANSFSGLSLTQRVWAKAGGYNYLMMNGPRAGDFTFFNLSDGTIGTTSPDHSNVTITDVGNGWYLCSIDCISDGSGAGFGMSNADNVDQFAGNGTDGIYLWGMHLYRSDLGGMVNNPDRGDSYVPTTSSAVYLPRRGHHKYNGDQWVNKGILVESEARTNLVPYSQETTGWTASSGSFTNNAATAPDGTNTAFLFTASASTAIASARTGTFVSSTGTHSVYIKNNGMDIVSIWIADGNSNPVIFDLTTGTIVTNSSQFGSIEDVGNGWYRISNGNTAVSSTQMRIYCGTGSTQTNNGTDGFYLWGAQVEAASTPSSYIPTNGASVTRAAETVTVPYANLPWPTPTYIGDELVTNGTFDTDVSGWTAANGGVLSVNNGAIRVTEDGVDGSTARAYQTITTEIGKVYLLSLDLVDTSDNFEVYVNTNPNYGGAIASSSTETDPQTLTLPFVATATTTYIIIGAGSPSTGIYSEYDNISVREINPLSVSIAMMGEMDYADEDAYATVQFYKWIKTADNFINATLTTNSTGTGRLIFIQEYNSDYQQVDSAGQSIYTPNINVPYSIAGRHGSNFLNVGAEGTSYTANTNIDGLPELSTADFNLAFDYMGTVSEFRIWDRDIGDTGIAEATKPSLEPSLSLTFDGQPSSFTNGSLVV